MKTGPSSLPSGVSRWVVRFVLLGGGLAWLFHLVGAWAIAEFGILSGLVESRWLGLDAVTVSLLAWSAAMLALAAAALLVAWRRRDAWQASAADGTEAARTLVFCARFGILANATFLAIIAVQVIPIFYFIRS